MNWLFNIEKSSENEQLSKRLELEKKMSLAKSHQIDKFERQTKQVKEFEQKGKVTILSITVVHQILNIICYSTACNTVSIRFTEASIN